MPEPAHNLDTITLELVRKGPPHNQLLSQLTDYLALCGDFEAESVHLPFDHADFEERQQSLQYKASPEERDAQLEEFGHQMGDLLGAVPGLIAALKAAKGDMTHLRLVVTPHELSLLPFESTVVPKGAPGGDGKWLLQTEAPVTITRKVRGVPEEHVRWPSEPRVLFAWASPSRVGSVPYEAHLLALRKALHRWIEPYAGTGGIDEQHAHHVGEARKYLTLLPDASIDDIRKACEETRFTHVHILAHGIPTDDRASRQEIGLALSHSEDKGRLDVVEGDRLAEALCYADSEDGMERPAVVTLASCDSGHVNSLITHGGSVAHELHLAGIPFVVASQFPLTIKGSVVVVEELYSRMFQAQDVRVALHHARQRLFTLFNDTHDWASIVAYASLPADFPKQLARNQYLVAKREIDRLFKCADIIVDRIEDGTAEDAEKQLDDIAKELDHYSEELIARGDDAVESVGLQASTEKRAAEVWHWMSTLAEGEKDRKQYAERSLKALERARALYETGMRANLSNHWVTVQYLSLTRYLQALGRLDGEFPEGLWTTARVTAEAALDSASDKPWAHGSLAELYLLKASVEPDDDIAKLAQSHIEELLGLVSADSFEIYSTRRQFARYVNWWGDALGVADLAKGIVARLGEPSTE